MKIKYLGTAAAEGWPALFCNCESCKRAKNLGGRDIRTRSQTIINDDLLIDFPCDTYMHVLNNGLDLSAVKLNIITHAHQDHWYPDDYGMRGGAFAHELTNQKVKLAAGKSVIESFRKADIAENIAKDIEIIELEAFKPQIIEGYKITAFPADHDLQHIAYTYLIEKDGQTIIYFHDTGMPYDSVFEYLTENKIHADFVSLDCTYCLMEATRGHMGMKCCADVKTKLIDLGICDCKTRFYVHHFSHNGNISHNEMSFEALKYGFNVSFDGCEIDMDSDIKKQYKYEIHCHTSEVSSCGKVSAEDVVKTHYNAGFTGVAITDHYYKGFFDKLGDIAWNEKIDKYLEGYRTAKKTAEALGMDLVLGMELRFIENSNDYLVYGITEELLYNYPELYNMTPETFYEFVKEHDLVIYQAHPSRKGLTRANPKYLTGVEVVNGNARHNSRNDRSLEFAEENSLRRCTGSDFHQPEDLDRACMVLDERVKDSIELKNKLLKI